MTTARPPTKLGRSKSLDSSHVLPIGRSNNNEMKQDCPSPFSSSFFASWFATSSSPEVADVPESSQSTTTNGVNNNKKKKKQCTTQDQKQQSRHVEHVKKSGSLKQQDTRGGFNVQQNGTFESSFDYDEEDNYDAVVCGDGDGDGDDGFAQDVEFVYDRKSHQSEITSTSSTNSSSYAGGSRTATVDPRDTKRPTLTNNRMYDSKTPVSLEGTLRYRKSRAATAGSSHGGWKNTYVVLDLSGYGSLTFLKDKPVLGEDPQVYALCLHHRR